jgi:hypothetical protein
VLFGGDDGTLTVHLGTLLGPARSRRAQAPHVRHRDRRSVCSVAIHRTHKTILAGTDVGILLVLSQIPLPIADCQLHRKSEMRHRATFMKQSLLLYWRIRTSSGLSEPKTQEGSYHCTPLGKPFDAHVAKTLLASSHCSVMPAEADLEGPDVVR